MKKIYLLWLLCICLIFACTEKKENTTTQDTVVSDASIEDLSYAFGVSVGRSIVQFDTEIDYDALVQGLKDALGSGSTKITIEEASNIINTALGAAQQRIAEKNKLAGEAFLEKNGKKKNVVTTTSGLQYEIIKEGDGRKPVAEDSVTVHYVGTLLNGDQFDSSRDAGEPVTFNVQGVIRGWTEGLQLMPVGSIYKFYIPADLAYGPQGAGADIGPNATLTFEVELISIAE